MPSPVLTYFVNPLAPRFLSLTAALPCEAVHARGVFGSAGAEAIAASPHLTGLRDLFLVGCGIGDAGAAALADSPNAARLRTLNLGLNNLTDAAALALAKSPHLDGLRAGWLHLGGNRGITPAGVDALRDRFGYDPTSADESPNWAEITAPLQT